MPYWYHIIITLFSDVLPLISVPLFFFFSGFLFFYRAEWSIATYKRKLTNRVHTLLLPYLLWNILAIAKISLGYLPFFAKIYPMAGRAGVNLSFSAIVYSFWDCRRSVFAPLIVDANGVVNRICPIDGPLWFVRDLMIVIICTPLVYALTKRIGRLLPILLGLAWYFTGPYNLGYSHQILVAPFFFSWGAYYSIRRLDFTLVFRKMPSFLPALYVVFVVIDIFTKGWSYNAYIDNAGIMLGVISIVIVTASLLDRGKISVNHFLAGSSFFVFALHQLILHSLGVIIITHIRSDSPYFLIVFYFLVPSVTILISLLLYKALNRFAPACASLLTGGR